ncbi:MAG: hypothetical protein WC148_05535 [Bacilli bacterium]|jgi:hypothetical protein
MMQNSLTTTLSFNDENTRDSLINKIINLGTYNSKLDAYVLVLNKDPYISIMCDKNSICNITLLYAYEYKDINIVVSSRFINNEFNLGEHLIRISTDNNDYIVKITKLEGSLKHLHKYDLEVLKNTFLSEASDTLLDLSVMSFKVLFNYFSRFLKEENL